MKRLALLLPFFLLTACTTVYEDGRPVFRMPSNATGLAFRSARGSTLSAATLDNAILYRAAGGAIAGAAMGVGAAIVTGGALKP